VSYTYDAIGRLTAVTGSGGLSAQLFTGMQYRAWGGLKHASYGDGPQLNIAYNARLLPMRYEMTNVFLSQLVYECFYCRPASIEPYPSLGLFWQEHRRLLLAENG
jgi:hypothetical protein